MLLSPPSHSVEEAADLLPTLMQAADATPKTLLELGSGGGVVIVPDYVRETFQSESSVHGEDGADGRGLRYLEWKWDPDPNDTTFEVAYVFVMRESDDSMRVEVDRHREGLFPRDAWLAWLNDAGFTVTGRLDPWNRGVFSGRRRA